MTFREWVDSQGKTGEERRSVRDRVASACGCGEVNVRHWYNGTRSIPPVHALTIQRETRGKVKAAEILEAAAA